MNCPHVTLKRKNVGNSHWHQCEACGQKFLAEKWDGKMQVVFPEAGAESKKEPTV